MAFKPPKEFDFRDPNTWAEWKERFLRYSICSELTEKSGAIQVNSLIYSMGADAKKIFKTFTFDNVAHKNEFDRVITKFDD